MISATDADAPLSIRDLEFEKSAESEKATIHDQFDKSEKYEEFKEIKVAVLDYGIGNIRSAEKALQHIGAAAYLADLPEKVGHAHGVVLPGVGAFGACADALRKTRLDRAALGAIEKGIPFLGICVGFQLLYEGSLESPGAKGLGIFSGLVEELPPSEKRPQMQWNLISRCRESRLLDGLADPIWAYFVHSYSPPIGQETTAVCEYGSPVAAVAERENVWGTQFHPEKSGTAGMEMLSNFVKSCSSTYRDELGS